MFYAQVTGGINDLILKYVHEGTWAGVLALGGYVVMYPLRHVLQAIKERFAVLDEVKKELEQQRTNHLVHIEQANEAQVKLLEGMAGTLTAMHLDQQRLLGKLDK